MKNHTKTLLTVCALCVAPLALAQPANGPTFGTVLPPLVRVGAPELYQPSTAERDAVVGQFELDNGVTLSVTRRGKRMLASLDGRLLGELKPLAPMTYVTQGGSTELKFEATPNASVFAVRMTSVPTLAQSQP